jgi:hypothetical protein
MFWYVSLCIILYHLPLLARAERAGVDVLRALMLTAA